MAIRKGTGTIKRVHAKNYAHREANKRLDESVRPYQQTGQNALGVDFVEVLLYQKVMSTQVCTCKQTEMVAAQTNISVSIPSNVINPNSNIDQDIVIDYTRPLFGVRGESATNLDYTSALDFSEDEEDYIEEDGLDDDEMPTRTSENLFSANSNCGLCYRSGYVPGYSLYGQDRQLLSTYTMSNVYGYNVNQSRAPHTFDKMDHREGFVEHVLNVPRYFKALKYSIRNNVEVLMEDQLFNIQGQPLTLAEVRSSAGSTISVRVMSETFTHVVVEFDLGIEMLHANISQMSKSIDWQNFDTLGSMNIVLPSTIREVQSTDYIVVPSRHQVLKVTDTPFLRTAKGSNLDTSINSRVVQPQEPVKRIYSGRFLL